MYRREENEPVIAVIKVKGNSEDVALLKKILVNAIGDNFRIIRDIVDQPNRGEPGIHFFIDLIRRVDN